MKKNIISRVILASAFALALVSCSQEFKYEPAKADDFSKSTYVGADVNAKRSYEVSGDDIFVPFLRNTTEGTLEVTLEMTDTSGIFKLDTPTITFADGDSLASAKVSYNYADLVMDVVYYFNIEVTNEDLLSSFVPATFPVSCIKAWENLGTAQFYDQWWVEGPFEKTLLKSPDGSENYRLVEPWNEEEVTDAGLAFVSQVPYLEFSVDDEGIITYAKRLDMGFKFSGMTCHMLHPTARKDAESAAKNCMVMANVAQFCWYPIVNYDPESGSFSWWGETAYAWISFPGGPDLAELLGL